MAPARPFQRLFGRTIQTKMLDLAWTHRDEPLNLYEASRRLRVNYPYTTNLAKVLARVGLLVRTKKGREVEIGLNPKHPLVRRLTTRR